MKVDLETQLRAYAHFLDDSAAVAGADVEPSGGELVVLGRAPSGRRHWLAVAAVVIALLGVGAAGLAVTRDSATTAASPPFPPRWQTVPDPTGVFVPPAEDPTRGDESAIGAQAPGGEVTEQNRLHLAAVTSTSLGWIAVGSETRVGRGGVGAVWQSADGLSWHRLAVDIAVVGALAPDAATGSGHWIDLTDVASAGDLVVATGTQWSDDVGAPFVAVSSDAGTTWRRTSLPTPDGLSAGDIAVADVVADDERFVIAGNTNLDSAAIAWVSSDGKNWELSAVGKTGQRSQSVGAVGDGFVIGGADEHHRAAAWFSPDGEHWEQSDLHGSTTPPAEFGQVLGIARSGDLVVAFVQEGTTERSTSMDAAGTVNVDGRSRLVAWSSPDGRTWTPVGLGAASDDYLYGFQATAGGDAGFVAVVQAFRAHQVHTIMLSSTDGSSWTTEEVVGLQSAPVDIAVDDDMWIAVANGDPSLELRFNDINAAIDAISSGAIWVGN